jgi:hypothetical protein
MSCTRPAVMTNPADLPDLWRERARLLRDYGGDPPASKAWEVAAAELEQALRTFRDESLNLTEAAKASGYTADHLGELVRSGKIPNAGRINAPRIRRADLPTKPNKRGRPRNDASTGRQDVARIADKLRT